MSKNCHYRKIVVGESWSNCVFYVIGSTFTLGKGRYKVSHIVENDSDPTKADIYVSQGDDLRLWKTLDLPTALDIEYDVNFE